MEGETSPVSGALGFASFLSYLGYGYLDTWHGSATLLLLPCFGLGMVKTWTVLAGDRTWRCLLTPARRIDRKTKTGLGTLCLLGTGLGKIGAGVTIMFVGMTSVFVDTDIAFLGMSPHELNAVNERLLPLIAHDRAGFGGGLVSCGVLVLLIVRKAPPSPHRWEALLFAGSAGFACAIGIHYPIGYVNYFHLAPAFAGLALFSAGLVLTYRSSFADRTAAPESFDGGSGD